MSVNNAKPELNNGAFNQLITLNISNKTFSKHTDKKGIATFNINTNEFKPSTHVFILNHPQSTISTNITSNYTLKIKDKIKQNVVKKTKKKIKKKTKKNKKTKKTKKKKRKNIIPKNNIKKNKKKSKIKTKTKTITNNDFSSKKKQIKSKNTISKNKKENYLLKGLSKVYGTVKEFLDYNLFKIPNYKKTLKSWGLFGSCIGFLADFFLGIDEDGQLNVGNLALNLLSLFCGVGLYFRGAKLLVKGAKLSKYLPKITKFVQKITNLIKNNKYLKQAVNFIKNIPNMIKNNKIVQKVANTIKNNKLVKKITNIILSNKYVRKAGNIIKNGWNSIKKLPNKIMNTLSSTKNNIVKNSNKLKNKAITFLTNEKHKFSFKLNSVSSKFKSFGLKINNIFSRVSGVISWVSRPDKKLFSKILNYGYKKYISHNRAILKSKNLPKIVKNDVYKKSLIAKAIKTYISNPIRTFKNVFFPDTKKIKKNIQNTVTKIKKYNPINNFKPKFHSNNGVYLRRRVYRPSLPQARVNTRQIMNRATGPVRRVLAPVRSALNRVGSFARKLIFKR